MKIPSAAKSFKQLKTVFILAVILVSGIFTSTCVQAQRSPPPISEEERARNRELDLRQTPLKIGPDCLPSGIMTKLNLKTLNEDQTKYFWLGQRYAVERTYREQLEQQRLMRINREADDQIAAIERRRNAENLAATGVKQYRSVELDRLNAQADAMMSGIDADIYRANQKWAEKCYLYTDQRSK
jgi:hypothetical protein